MLFKIMSARFTRQSIALNKLLELGSVGFLVPYLILDLSSPKSITPCLCFTNIP
jgi:hypothetical protein